MKIEQENDYTEFYKELCEKYQVLITKLKNELKSKKSSKQYSVILSSGTIGSVEEMSLEELIKLITTKDIKQITIKM